jgi:hypothetical protein
MKFKYKVRRTPKGYRATVAVPISPTQVVLFTGDAAVRDTKKALKAVQASGVEVGGIFGSIGKAVGKLTKSKALRKAVGGAIKVLDNPAVTGTLMAVNPALGIGIKTGVSALKQGEKLISTATKAPKGSRERIQARAAIRMANNAAKRGAKLPTKAKKAVKYIAMVTQG